MKHIINEDLARAAKNAISFDDYKEGSATAEYNLYCERFQQKTDEIIRSLKEPMTEEQAEGVAYWTEKYKTKLAYAINRKNEITARCPSVMIVGPANFPVKKKQKQNAAYDKFYKEYGELFTPETCYYMDKIEILLTNDTIYSNDQFALVKLNQKLDEEEAAHAEMIKQNDYYRKHQTMAGYEGLTAAQAERMDAKINSSRTWKKPFPDWELTNSSARIRQIKKRIANIERLKQRAETSAANKYPAAEGVTVTENSELMRYSSSSTASPTTRRERS